MIAMSAPLEEVLDHLMRLIESHLTGISCSVLLLDPDGIHLKHAAAPNILRPFSKLRPFMPVFAASLSCSSVQFVGVRPANIVPRASMADLRSGFFSMSAASCVFSASEKVASASVRMNSMNLSKLAPPPRRG